jgi:hypothetical protein
MDWHVCNVPSLTVQAIYVLLDQPFISQPVMNGVRLYMAIPGKPFEIPQQKLFWV